MPVTRLIRFQSGTSDKPVHVNPQLVAYVIEAERGWDEDENKLPGAKIVFDNGHGVLVASDPDAVVSALNKVLDP